MSEGPMSEPDVDWLAGQLKEPAAAEFLIEVRRIADALERLAGKPHCDGINPETGEQCALGETHVGYHVPADGRKPWLDTE